MTTTILEMANQQVLALIEQGFVDDKSAPLTTERIYNKILELSQRTTVADLRKVLDKEAESLVHSVPTSKKRGRGRPATAKYGVHHDHIVCLECNQHFSRMSTHLLTHDLTIGEYRERHSIPRDVKLICYTTKHKQSQSMKVAWRKPLEDWETPPTYRRGRQWADVAGESL